VALESLSVVAFGWYDLPFRNCFYSSVDFTKLWLGKTHSGSEADQSMVNHNMSKLIAKFSLLA